MEHILNIEPKDYVRVKSGSMTFQIRSAENSYQQGDTVILKEFDYEPINATSRAAKGFTGSQDLEFKVGHVHILDSSRVVFSLISIKNNNKRK